LLVQYPSHVLVDIINLLLILLVNRLSETLIPAPTITMEIDIYPKKVQTSDSEVYTTKVSLVILLLLLSIIISVFPHIK